MKCKTILGLLTILACNLVATTSHASSLGTPTVLYNGWRAVQGYQANATTLQLPSAGVLSLTLTDLNFPTSFASGSLQLDLTDSSSTLLGLEGPGTWNVDVTGPMTLYANVFANAQGLGVANIGLYTLTASFMSTAPVTLPATGTLLASVTLLAGLLELLWRMRRKGEGFARTTVTLAVA